MPCATASSVSSIAQKTHAGLPPATINSSRASRPSCCLPAFASGLDLSTRPSLTEGFQPWPATIVEHPHADVGIIEAERPDNGLLQHFDRLIIGRDEDVDGWQLTGRQGA